MRLTRLALAACVCVSLYPSLALAQDEAFKKGMQARGDKNWAEVARQMRSAIQGDGQESTRKVRSNIVASVFGGGGVEYLPHYFLGEALKNQQDCAGAVTEWATSLDQKVVQSKADFVLTIQRGFKECQAKGVLLPEQFDAMWKTSRQAYIDAAALAKRVTDLGASHRDQWLPLASQYDEPHKDLETASVRLNTAQKTRSASDFNEVKLAAERATVKLRALEDALNSSIENLATIQQKIKDADQAIGNADSADKAIDGVKAVMSEQLAASRKAGREQLALARTQLAAAQKTQNVVAVNEAMKYAQSATASFSQVLDQLRRLARGALDQQLSEAVRVADEAFLSVSALMETMNRRAAQRPDKLTPEMTGQRDALQKKIDAQRSRYERVRKSEDLAGLADVTKQTQDAQSALNQLIQAFGPLTLRDRGVHAALEEGARLFFDGEYQKAIAALDPSSGVTDASLQVHVHLFRAAAFYGLFVRSGEKRQDLRSSAIAEIQQCKQLSSSFEPDARVFAPRFITLYKTGGAVPSQTATATTQQ
jgi:hypothetical protein